MPTPTGNLQTNTQVYWNYIYTTPAREKEYWSRTSRFPTVVSYVKDNDKFIDLGCGVAIPGRLIRKERKNCEIWGVDISDEVIENNKKDDPESRYFQGYIGDLSFLPKSYFDISFSGETIEHLDDPSILFSDAYRILNKKGKLIITTPIEDHVNSPEHVWSFNKKDIQDLFKNSGFKTVEFVNLPDMEYLVVFFAVGTK